MKTTLWRTGRKILDMAGDLWTRSNLIYPIRQVFSHFIKIKKKEI